MSNGRELNWTSSPFIGIMINIYTHLEVFVFKSVAKASHD